jgi:hypothetical protein
MSIGERIEALKNDAAVAGDLAMVAVCERALDGDQDAHDQCERVISEARAQEDARARVLGARIACV